MEKHGSQNQETHRISKLIPINVFLGHGMMEYFLGPAIIQLKFTLDVRVLIKHSRVPVLKMFNEGDFITCAGMAFPLSQY